MPGHMRFICGRRPRAVAFKRPQGLIAPPQTNRAAHPAADAMRECANMQDFLWVLLAFGLAAATLAYARLCGNA